ncbi:hypothetical protein ACVWYQ_003016 [Bradyrhizobium sp. USDA 3397]
MDQVETYTEDPSARPKLRIGILTFHFSDNYGALMQAYGLREWLLRSGFAAEFINYHPTHVEQGGAFILGADLRTFKANAKIAFLKLSALRRLLFGNRRQDLLFEEFRRNMLGVKGAPLRTKVDVEFFLNSMEGRFDLIICGSDQIWSPSAQRGLDPTYFAYFPSLVKSTRRISYAASFGRNLAGDAAEPQFLEYLSALDAISVREKSGEDFVVKILGRKPNRAPDPTILLADFSALYENVPVSRESYVFCYALRTGTKIRSVATLVSNEHGCGIKSPYNPHRRWREIGTTIYSSPVEWLAAMRDAKFVVTNSFHGVVFSVLLRKPFVVVALPGSKSPANDRAMNLLQELGLGSRLVSGDDPAAVKKLINEPIDWEGCAGKLLELKRVGEDYLRHQISATVK